MSRIAGTPLTPPTLPMASTSPGLIPQNSIEKPEFKNFLIESLEQVNNMQADADKAVETLMTGGDVNPAEVLTAVQKADLTFRMMMQIRNKLVTAYQEIKDVRI